MAEKAGTATSGTQGFYDRIADVHNLALKLNGYRDSVAYYLRSLDVELDEDSLVLDAGSGTGLITLAFQDAGFHPKHLVAYDLSHVSLGVGRDEVQKTGGHLPVSPVQGDILQLPFSTDTFDLVMTCGVLEYVSLDEGLREMARVLRPGGHLVHIPIKPSLVGSVLEYLYKFKTHPVAEVNRVSRKHFELLGKHKFSITEPIGWSKSLYLLRKPLTGADTE